MKEIKMSEKKILALKFNEPSPYKKFLFSKDEFYDLMKRNFENYDKLIELFKSFLKNKANEINCDIIVSTEFIDGELYDTFFLKEKTP